MQLVANGIRIEAEEHGSPGGEPLLLIMGLGMQLVAWHEDFVASLVARRFRVIRFDNRDAGLSQGFDELGVPSLVLDTLRFTFGLRVRSPYGLADMADDSVGVLDALGIAQAHICGASMGGMIAQQVALRHPGRVKSLTLMMTSSGARSLPSPSMKVRGAMLARPDDPACVDSVVAHYVRLYRLIGSPGFPASDDYLNAQLQRAVRRAYRPRGVARQLVAIAADGDRSRLLDRIIAPTQIVHGNSDPLIPVAAAHDLAAKIRGAGIDLIDGMGHDLPEALWPRFVANLADVAARV